jgi:raffinose/stachyose/melibiose transport system substrate-binding protein
MNRSPQRDRPARRGWSLLVAAVGVLTLVAACGSSSSSSSSTTASINVWWVTNGTNVNDLWQTIATDFDNSHPGDKVNIDIEPSSNSYKDKLTTALGGSGGPTLFFSWGGGPLQGYINAGGAQPFADPGQNDAGSPSWKDKFLASSLGAVTFNNKIYGMPILGTQPVFFFYNKSVFTSAGMSFPTTMDQLTSDCSTFNAKGIIPIALGNADEWEGLMYLEYFTDREGGPQAFLNIQGNKANAWSGDAVTKALGDIQTLVNDKCFNPGYDTVTYTNGSTDALVYNGKAAMQLMGDWDLGGIQSNDASIITSGGIGIGDFPTVSGGSGDAADLAGNTTSYTALASHITKAQAYVAEQFMEYFYTQTYAIAEIGDGQVPVISGTSSLLGASSLSTYLLPVYQAVQSAPHFQYSWDQSLPPADATPMLDNLAKIFELTETPAQFSAAMNPLLSS